MEVREGWNTPMGRKKFDVTFEEADLRRILIENGIPAEHAPDLPANLVFQLLECSARGYAKLTLAQNLAADEEPGADQALREAQAAKEAREKVLDRVRQHLGLLPDTGAAAGL
jgi:hypothetical protein